MSHFSSCDSSVAFLPLLYYLLSELLSCLQVSVTLNFPQASDTEAKCPPF